MDKWWYSVEPVEKRPVSKNDASDLFIKVYITTSTLFRKEGMESWSEMNDLPELRPISLFLADPGDPSGQNNATAHPLAGRWKRSFGRVFDTSIEMYFLVFLLETLFEKYAIVWMEWFFTPEKNPFFPLFFLPITFIFDAIIYRVFGNTPGKYLLGLYVEHVTPAPLRFLSYLNRNFYLWFSGFALGLPLVNFYRMFYQLIRLGKKKQTTYDEALAFRVRAKPIGWIRVVVFVVLFGYISSWHTVCWVMDNPLVSLYQIINAGIG
ncbi:RDD family protein [Acerihabitans sp. TG2]|uniref:RDD family protein n=1 Tax=Acerihabitans sp. TG2 TaxID=3096008 RepID=UPI002B22491C|nr:RDD family protein [Acerihabitans sp. TG2]MEA9390005.1 RDD family protein [Acerihabitans sp. TG2]